MPSTSTFSSFYWTADPVLPLSVPTPVTRPVVPTGTLTPPRHGCSWEREKTPHHAQDEGPERDEQQAVVDAAGDESESADPHEGALAGEDVSLLLATQQKTVALQVGRGRQPRRQSH